MRHRKTKKEIRKSMTDAAYRDMKKNEVKEPIIPRREWRKLPEFEYDPETLQQHDTEKK